MIVKQFFSKNGSLYFPEILREIIGSLKGQKLVEFLRKIITFEENSENSSQFKFLGLLKKTSADVFFYPKMVHNIVLFDFSKLYVWEEFCFSVIPQNAVNQSGFCDHQYHWN